MTFQHGTWVAIIGITLGTVVGMSFSKWLGLVIMFLSVLAPLVGIYLDRRRDKAREEEWEEFHARCERGEASREEMLKRIFNGEIPEGFERFL